MDNSPLIPSVPPLILIRLALKFVLPKVSEPPETSAVPLTVRGARMTLSPPELRSELTARAPALALVSTSV